MSFRVGDYIKTIPVIQAIDMANKTQIADTIAYYKKSLRYDSGNIMDTVTSRLTPDICAAMNPKLSADEIKDGAVARLNQYLYRKVLNEFKQTGFYAKARTDARKLETALRLWWSWSARDVILRLKDSLVAEARKPNYKEIAMKKENFISLKGITKPKDRWEALHMM